MDPRTTQHNNGRPRTRPTVGRMSLRRQVRNPYTNANSSTTDLATIYTILPTTNRYKARLVLFYRAKLNFDREISFPKTHFQAIYLETFSERFLEKKSKLDISLLIKFTLERQF